MNRIKIVSDGTIRNTKVIDSVTGSQLGLVQKVTIHPLNVGDSHVRATVEFLDVELNLQDVLYRRPSLWRRLLLALTGRRTLAAAG